MSVNPAIRTEKLTLEDGYELTHTTIGEQSTILLFVVGSSGHGSLYHKLAIALSSHFKCVYYDKRGFLPRKSDDKVAAETKNPFISATRHADDAAALIRHFSPSKPVYVFGTSTGGTAVLDLAIRYHQFIHTAILHEPITFSVLPMALGNEMVAVYRHVSTLPDPIEALNDFAGYMLQTAKHAKVPPTKGKRQGSVSESSPSALQVYTSRQGQREAQAMVDYTVDIDKARSISDKLVVIGGMDSSELQVSKAGKALAFVLGSSKRVWELTGGHMSFADKLHAVDFSQQLLFVLHQEGRLSLADAKL